MGSNPIPRSFLFPMRCSRCSRRAVFKDPTYCKEHFIKHIEARVHKTIRDYALISPKDKVLVACSGGKDSTACLHILSKRYRVEALAIDEGIVGYRERTLNDLKRFCIDRAIPLHICSLRELYGVTLDELIRKEKAHPCTVCGSLRRSLINRCAREHGAAVVATGHNLDDESQSVVMNFLRNQLGVSARLGPKTGLVKDDRFVPRVKPLYFCTEKEITAYCHLMGFDISFVECPYTLQSYRNVVRELLNEYESSHPGTKRRCIGSFLKMLPALKKRYNSNGSPGACALCGEPVAAGICPTCSLTANAKLLIRSST
jgi:tRNA-5-methyluridine54 2-sulfurtransferase